MITKPYGDRLEEHAVECSSVYSDNMLVYNYVQALLPTTQNTFTDALHRMTIDERFSFSNLVYLAQAEGQTYRPRSSLYEKITTVMAKWKPVMLMAILLYNVLCLQYGTTDPS